MPPLTVNPQIQITPKQLQVLRQISSFQKNRCYSATIGELAQALGISRPTAFEHIAALREKNLLAKSTGRARCLRLSASGAKLLKQADRCEPDTITNCGEGIYLRGCVSAGYGIDAIEDNQPFSLGEVFGNRGDLFALQVRGQSMTGAGIKDGDYVICRQAATADNGQLVVALLDNGENATLKRFFKDTDSVRLQPENDAFEPILSRHCRIQAVVVGLVRHF
jgi:repressor LexA